MKKATTRMPHLIKMESPIQIIGNKKLIKTKWIKKKNRIISRIKNIILIIMKIKQISNQLSNNDMGY